MSRFQITLNLDVALPEHMTEEDRLRATLALEAEAIRRIRMHGALRFEVAEGRAVRVSISDGLVPAGRD